MTQIAAMVRVWSNRPARRDEHGLAGHHGPCRFIMSNQLHITLVNRRLSHLFFLSSADGPHFKMLAYGVFAAMYYI